jgi:hypothetical protein
MLKLTGVAWPAATRTFCFTGLMRSCQATTV